MSETERSQLQDRILQYPEVENLLRNKSFRVLALQTEDLDPENSEYNLQVYNETDDQLYEVNGPLNMSITPQILESFEEIPATPEEFEAAFKILSEDPQLGPLIQAQTLLPYEAMPPILQPHRLIPVGLISNSNPSSRPHEIVGVDLSSRQVTRFPKGAPAGAIAIEQVCGMPNAHQANTAKGVRGSAEIEIEKGDQLLWSFTVIRPSASSGKKGSGLELRNLYYKGKKVFSRAHTPILNVQYDDNRCGPFRDWGYSENPFVAVGSNLAPGIRLASEPPKTIFDTHDDRGQFRGVAIYSSEGLVTLTTELSAGWYRYVSKFELYDDGRIKPIFQFSGVTNSCVCFSHHHNVYWRIDFDVQGVNNSIQVSNGSTFRVIPEEISQIKSPENQVWRIGNSVTGSAYDLTPGASDGVADDYSIADVWLLRYSPTQIDDSRVRTSTKAALNAFLTGGNLVQRDVVMWYTGHFAHLTGEAEVGHGIVGPTLAPVNWPEE